MVGEVVMRLVLFRGGMVGDAVRFGMRMLVVVVHVCESKAATAAAA